jgi:hypothetical protein
MPEIEMPDPEELGGNVTKPFKFVTGMNMSPETGYAVVVGAF